MQAIEYIQLRCFKLKSVIEQLFGLKNKVRIKLLRLIHDKIENIRRIWLNSVYVLFPVEVYCTLKSIKSNKRNKTFGDKMGFAENRKLNRYK